MKLMPSSCESTTVGIPEVVAIACLVITLVLALDVSLLWFYPWQFALAALVITLSIGLCILGRSLILYLALIGSFLTIIQIHWLVQQPVSIVQLIEYGRKQLNDSSIPVELRMTWSVITSCPSKYKVNPPKLVPLVNALNKDAYISLKSSDLSGINEGNFYTRHCF